ncbi:MAG: ABC transporter permease subunit [Chthoniobacteraceae bacterium]|nr:ABC transporter permease subunit [Chthoniobacteraceae bacterium]
MTKFLTLLSREVKSTFYSPIAYIVMCFFLALTGLCFYSGVAFLSRGATELTVVEAFFDSVPFWIGFILIFPPITMRLFAEEFKMGTIETLMTAPVSDGQVVLAKFGGALIFYCILWLPTLLYFVIFQQVARTDAALAAGAYWGSYLELLLVGMFFLSVGCFSSVLTQNQIVAAVISLSLIVMFFLGGLVAFFSPNISPVLRMVSSYFSPLEHMGEFSKGLIDTRRFVFYGSGTALMLLLTHLVFQYRRWKA